VSRTTLGYVPKDPDVVSYFRSRCVLSKETMRSIAGVDKDDHMCSIEGKTGSKDGRHPKNFAEAQER
jgi:hypothetical protein